MVAGWGIFLIQGVYDPLGGINSLWPLFGIANQMLAAIALCLATTIILKMQLSANRAVKIGKPAFALVVLIPLLWLLAVTLTASWEKIFNPDPRIGFLASAKVLDGKLPELQTALTAAQSSGDASALATASKALTTNRTLHFNNLLDAVVAGFFLVMVVIIALISLRQWIGLLARQRDAVLHETAPVWLPDYAVAEAKPANIAGIIALSFALAKELSSEAHQERAEVLARQCACATGAIDLLGERKAECAKTRGEIYAQVTEKRFNGINRCC
jgi:carbon starvation protein